MSDKGVLKEISRKLDRIIALQQIGIREELNTLKVEIKKDKISLKILQIADGTLSAGEMQKTVANITGTSEVTVKRRTSELLDKGLLLQNREGYNIYYINSGIIEV